MYALPPQLGRPGAGSKEIGSLTELQKALNQVRSTRPTPPPGGNARAPRTGNVNPNASPSTLASTPDETTSTVPPEYQYPATGPMSAALLAGRDQRTLDSFAGLHRAPATTDLSTSFTGPSPAMRSELKALQEGLMRLKSELATRRARSKELTSSTSFGASPKRGNSSRPPNTLTKSSAPPTHEDVTAPFLPQMKDINEEDAISQTDSAAPSTTLQSHIMSAIQTLTTRLAKLEGQQQNQRLVRTTDLVSTTDSPLNNNEESKSFFASNRTQSPTSSKPLAQQQQQLKSVKDSCIESCLESELTMERLRRLKLEAIIKALAPRVGLDPKALISVPLETRVARHAAEREFDAAALQSLQYGELRRLVEELSIRNREALRLYTSSKSKSVELTAALRTVSDLSMRIVTLEEEINSLQNPSMSKSNEKGVATNDTIGTLSLRVRHQNMKIRAMQNELNALREITADAQFKLVGNSAKNIEDALTALKTPTKSNASAVKSRSASSSPVRKPPLTSLIEVAVAKDNPFTSSNSTPETQKSSEVRSQSSIYKAVPSDPVDVAIADFLNTLGRPVKVLPIRVSPGHYLYGRLAVRGGLSATSKIPLIFYNGKKFSLRKFIQTYEDIEYALRSVEGETTAPQVESESRRPQLISSQGLRTASSHHPLSQSGPPTSDPDGRLSAAKLLDKIPLNREVPKVAVSECYQNDLGRSYQYTQPRPQPPTEDLSLWLEQRYQNSDRSEHQVRNLRSVGHTDESSSRQSPVQPPRVIELPSFPTNVRPRSLQVGLTAQPQGRTTQSPVSLPRSQNSRLAHSRRETPSTRQPFPNIPIQSPFLLPRPSLGGWDRNPRLPTATLMPGRFPGPVPSNLK